MAQAARAIEDQAARFEILPIASVIPSKTNPRAHFNEEYLQQLAASITEKGIIEPLIVRPLKGKLEIVAGECRYRAASLANQAQLPCIIRELSDEQALEIQIIENLHRKDLTPLEEASGFRALIKTNPDKHSATTIAARIGKSPSWVWDIMKLLDLVPEAQKLLDAGMMSANHAILIARLKPDQQKKVIDPEDGGLFVDESRLHFDDTKDEPGDYDEKKPVTVRELSTWINDHIRFDPKQAAKAAPLEFEAVAEKVDEAAARPGRGKKVVSITHEYHLKEDARDANERTYSTVSWRRADGSKGTTPDPRNYGKFIDSPKCEHSVLGVVVAGRGYGETFDVCIARDRCTVHWGKEIASRAKAQKQRAAGNGNGAGTASRGETDAQKRRREEADLASKAEDAALKLITKAALEKLKEMPAAIPKQVFARLIDALQGDTPLRTVKGIKGLTQSNLAHALTVEYVKADLEDGWDDALVVEWATALGVNVKKLEAEAKGSLRLQTSGVKKQANQAGRSV